MTSLPLSQAKDAQDMARQLHRDWSTYTEQQRAKLRPLQRALSRRLTDTLNMIGGRNG